MIDEECIHGLAPDRCETCLPAERGKPGRVDQQGEEKWLIYCRSLADDTLLHFVRRAETYKLRAYTGRRAGETWTQEDATTASEFMRKYQPEFKIDAKPYEFSVERTERWAAIITERCREFGVG